MDQIAVEELENETKDSKLDFNWIKDLAFEIVGQGRILMLQTLYSSPRPLREFSPHHVSKHFRRKTENWLSRTTFEIVCKIAAHANPYGRDDSQINWIDAEMILMSGYVQFGFEEFMRKRPDGKAVIYELAKIVLLCMIRDIVLQREHLIKMELFTITADSE